MPQGGGDVVLSQIAASGSNTTGRVSMRVCTLQVKNSCGMCSVGEEMEELHSEVPLRQCCCRGSSSVGLLERSGCDALAALFIFFPGPPPNSLSTSAYTRKVE